MSQYQPKSAKVLTLPTSVAMRIAAGEVIERPESIIRELLDNAIDAGASEITVFLELGGMSVIRVIDNGSGMRENDLRLCHLPHTTSKLRKISDLDNLDSLGFRGEALASIAASARLHIKSMHSDEKNAFELIINTLEEPIVQPTSLSGGTVIEIRDLFYAIPARKKFLKGAGVEFKHCRRIFHDKALAFPHITFRLFHNGKNTDLLIKSSLVERYVQILQKTEINKSDCSLVEAAEEGIKLSILAVTPSAYRRDRKGIQIFCNHRKIDDYALVQAVCYGYEAVLPGGLFPYACVFLEIDPHLIDFNIHPAKREVRFRNPGLVHRIISQNLRRYLSRFHLEVTSPTLSHKVDASPDLLPTKTYSPEILEVLPLAKTEKRTISQQEISQPDARPFYSPEVMDETKNNIGEPLPETYLPPKNIAPLKSEEEPTETKAISRYIGQFLNLYLLAEYDERLFIIDQHAAHETVILQQIIENPPAAQELLIPLVFEVSTEESLLIKQKQENLSQLGLMLLEQGKNQWVLESLPGGKELSRQELIDFLISPHHDVEQLRVILYEKMACRRAIKEGDLISDYSARQLVENTFKLTKGRCPHGRPLWYELDKKTLDKLVLRNH